MRSCKMSGCPLPAGYSTLGNKMPTHCEEHLPKDDFAEIKREMAAEAILAQFDNDPNPYGGTYSEM